MQRARVTKAAPPKPAANPLQFVQIKPCNLYQSAQEHLKRAEEVKKVKEIVKEEPEDWQSVSFLIFFVLIVFAFQTLVFPLNKSFFPSMFLFKMMFILINVFQHCECHKCTTFIHNK